MNTKALVAAFVLLGVAACDGAAIEASGTIIAETRDLGPFERIAASRGVRVRLTVDPEAAHSVVVNYDDNLVDNVDTRVDGNTLKVVLDGEARFSGSGDRYVEITMPSLTRVDVTSGAGLTATGSVTELEVGANGGGNVDLGGLDVEMVTVDVGGGANVTVRATGTVEGSASGGANLTLLGDPQRVEVDTSGGANITRR